MKSESNIRPLALLPLGNGFYHLNYNVIEVEIEGQVQYQYDSIYVDTKDRDRLVEALIAERYSLQNELKILYRGTDEEKAEHERYVQWCKDYIDSVL